MGVKPWELIEQPHIWITWAGQSMAAEAYAKKVANEKASMSARSSARRRR